MDSLSLPDLFASRSPSGTGAICSPTSAPYRGQRAPATDDNSGDDKPAEFKTDSVFPSHVAFSPDGDLLSFARVTPGGDSAIHLLLWRPEQLTREACQRLTRNLDEGEWRGYIGTEPYRKTCPSLR